MLQGLLGKLTRRLPILCYHGVSIEDEHIWNPELFVTAAHFRARLIHLKQRGYRFFALREGLAHLYRGTLPPRAICITFDDALYDFYAIAWPILRELSIPATMFVPTKRCLATDLTLAIKARYLAWKGGNANPAILRSMSADQIRELSDVDFQMHTHEHRLEGEASITENRRVLQEITGREVDILAYPGNSWASPRLAKRCGVRFGLTTYPRTARAWHHPLMLPRICDNSTISESRFSRLL